MHSELTCACCGISIRWQPTLVEGQIYCCSGCAQGGPCVCDYDNLPQPDQVHALMVREHKKTVDADPS
jgi:hypothetical protein